MFYDFPTITDISQVRDAIKGKEEFIEAERDGYTVFNYLVRFESTFPKVCSELDAILRECRGITFDSFGKVIARKYHKFFNIGEIEECRDVDFTQPHIILEKLDGSMIVPMMVKSKLEWHTKMGNTDVAKKALDFVNKHPKYVDIAMWCISQNMTPMFEFLSRRQRIVVDYPEENLVLTAIRYNETGEYVSY